jgi:hypothetical protein
MRTTVLVMAVTGLIAVTIAWVYLSPERLRTPVATEEVPAVLPAVSEAPKTKLPEVADEGGSREDAGQLPLLDESRLFDKSYEVDPDLVAIAGRAGVPPACIIAIAKQQFHGIQIRGECPSPAELGPETPSLAVGADTYAGYSDADLESLATSDPRAAVVLARRVKSDAEAKRLYDRAVALSGVGSPLLEWMYARADTGLTRHNGQLDVAAAREGYKTHLIVAAVDGYQDPILETFQRELSDAGVDLSAIEREAAEEVARLRQERKALTGEGL